MMMIIYKFLGKSTYHLGDKTIEEAAEDMRHLVIPYINSTQDQSYEHVCTAYIAILHEDN